MGLPLATEPLDPTHPDEIGYRIPREQYELPDPGLDEDELAALRLASAAVQLDGDLGPGRHVGGPCASWAAPRRRTPVRRRPVRARSPRAGRAGRPAGRRRGGGRLRGHRRAAPGAVHLPGRSPGGGPLAAVLPPGPVVPGRPRTTAGARSACSAWTGWTGRWSSRAGPGAFARPPAHDGGPAARRGASATTTRSSPSCWSTPSRPGGPSRPWARTR